MAVEPSPAVLEIRDLRIEAKSSDSWSEIVRGVSLSLCKGEVLGLVGESGAGKSTVGLAALGYLRPGARASGGSVRLLDIELLAIPEEERRRLRGTKVAYVAQSAQAAFNPVHRLMDQITLVAVDRGACRARRPRSGRWRCSPRCSCPIRRTSARATRIRCRAASCSGPWSRWR